MDKTLTSVNNMHSIEEQDQKFQGLSNLLKETFKFQNQEADHLVQFHIETKEEDHK